MHKNQLQELAQRSCFNLPSYSCIREGPDHAPRFKATVNFNGETFESPTFFSTLRQAEHAAAEVALNTLAKRGPSRALAAKALDETGVYKNLLQETAHRAGLNLPVYTTVRTGPGHIPTFSCMVELAGMSFVGEPARTKKQAQKNAAMAAWTSLKQVADQGSSAASSSSNISSETSSNQEQEQAAIARILSSLRKPESKHTVQNGFKCEGQRRLPICRDLTQSIPSRHHSCSEQWAYPHFYSPGFTLYQMWQQQQLSQLHHLFRLPISITPPQPLPPPFLSHQVLPYMQSILDPEYLCLPVQDTRSPSSSFSELGISTSRSSAVCSTFDCSRNRSTVTIREIHDVKSEKLPCLSGMNCEPGLGKWTLVEGNDNALDLDGRVDRDAPKGMESPGLRQDSHQSSDLTSRSSALHAENSYGFEHPQPRQRHGFPQRGFGQSVRPRPVLEPSAGGIATHHVPSYRPERSLRFTPMPERMSMGGLHRQNFMAPPVRVRSVVPVCSAPPRETRNPAERQKNGAPLKSVTLASSETERLQM